MNNKPTKQLEITNPVRAMQFVCGMSIGSIRARQRVIEIRTPASRYKLDAELDPKLKAGELNVIMKPGQLWALHRGEPTKAQQCQSPTY